VMQFGSSRLIALRIAVHVPLVKTMVNVSRKSESTPFSLNGSERGFGFHLYLDFLCRQTAATTDMM